MIRERIAAMDCSGIVSGGVDTECCGCYYSGVSEGIEQSGTGKPDST